MSRPAPRTSYDPYELVADVSLLLIQLNIPAAVRPGESGHAVDGARTLLRALGVFPEVGPESIIAFAQCAEDGGGTEL